MKNTVPTILYIIAFIVGFSLLYFSGLVEQKTPVTDQAIQQTDTKQNLGQKTDEQALVTVTVTPINISPQSKEWKFNIVIDTHSVELDQDMTKSTTLTNDQGKEYRPLRWEGAVAGGHHREGALVWSAIEPMPKSVEINIRDIGEIPERSFKWDLK